jgi:hypothetical protein
VAQPDVSLWLVLAFAALNPAVILVGYSMGRRADQLAKLVIAAFAAALSGILLLWFGALVRLPFFSTAGRAAVGVFVAALVFGGLWAAVGYRKRSSTGT